MKIPPAYLSKVMQKLAHGGIVYSVRGNKGGFRLAVEPDKLNLLSVVNTVDPFTRSQKHPLGPTHQYHLSPLHDKLNNAVSLVENAFYTTNLADLIPEQPDQ